ncbi:UxaA family hydrolase [Leucothrix arctica]|uniref:Galactonate dehydratase n=1 Tax=Leucothrix arctica TaxID=1481894 RepID=A0A317C726_9GAMM|nr:altronate dehydratase family protein [Leucothrix arctica]PWQ94446.1 galactonate dehydratase [Leucothrix arctica]
MSTEQTSVQLHENDNVRVAIATLIKGISSSVETPVSTIPLGHKFASAEIKTDEPIIKYNQIIGFASEHIAKGDHVHTHNCQFRGDFERDSASGSKSTPTQFFAADQRATFMGFKRANGKVGTRNYLAVMTTVNCSATVAKMVAKHFEDDALDDYPNIDGVVAFAHSTGCGMGMEGDGYDNFQRILHGYATHPNFAGVLMIGLGCETAQISDLKKNYSLADDAGFQSMTIQGVGGTRKAVAEGIKRLEQMLPAANACIREKVSAEHLTLALQCGGSDGYSGITANPALGAAADLLVRHGGTAILAETPEIYGAEHLLTERANTQEVADKLMERIRWWEHYTRINNGSIDNNPSPGNKAGGLTTILEKSLGAVAKGGTTDLMQVLKYAEPVTEKGFVFMDSPGYDPVSVTGEVASGATVVCFTTGRGSVFGYKPSPSIKLATNSQLYEHMSEDMDINCGEVLSAGVSIDEMGERIFQLILKVASGQPSKSEALGFGDNEFNPWMIGTVM